MSRIPPVLRERIRQRAAACCEYCHLPDEFSLMDQGFAWLKSTRTDPSVKSKVAAPFSPARTTRSKSSSTCRRRRQCDCPSMLDIGDLRQHNPAWSARQDTRQNQAGRPRMGAILSTPVGLFRVCSKQPDRKSAGRSRLLYPPLASISTVTG
jgi:hypothetical protein